MELAISTVDGPIDYINAHGTSTPVGISKQDLLPSEKEEQAIDNRP
jgi:hypothetical protein